MAVRDQHQDKGKDNCEGRNQFPSPSMLILCHEEDRSESGL
jgi:hypothetical protein